jgi:hypothetical protein
LLSLQPNLVELGHVYERAVGAELARRVRVGLDLLAPRLGALVAAPDLGKAQEEALVWGKAVDFLVCLVLRRLLEGLVNDGEAANVKTQPSLNRHYVTATVV